ncbi:MAG: hypothetical protein OXC18_18475 [Desulfurellaceae bacterium]|nr:hypothetical protein [Desulfurellaceae bacterium]
MKRDMEVVKKILETLQLGDTLRFWSPGQIYEALRESSEGGQRIIKDHLELLLDEGFVTEVIEGDEDYTLRLTWKGYDLLEALPQPRNPEAEAAIAKANLGLKHRPR